MKFTPQLDNNGQWYWQVEMRTNGRLMLAEGRTFKEALENSLELIEDLAVQAAQKKLAGVRL